MKPKPKNPDTMNRDNEDVPFDEEEGFRKARLESLKALEKAWDHYLRFVDLMITTSMGSALVFVASIKFVDWSSLPGKAYVAPSIICGLLAFALFVMWRYASQHYLELQLLYPQYTVFVAGPRERPMRSPVSPFRLNPGEKVGVQAHLFDERLWKYGLRPIVWFCWRPAPILAFAALLLAWGFALLALFTTPPTWLKP
jgi:hypothetical protein